MRNASAAHLARQGNDAALWCEGPVWMGDWGCLLWSDIPNHRVLRWSEDDGHVSVFQTESGYSNGHARDNQGRLIADGARYSPCTSSRV